MKNEVTMRASQLRRILREERKMKCAKCPIPQRTCNAIAKGLWGEERCLLRIVLREILIFHTAEEQKRGVEALKVSRAPKVGEKSILV